jgi:ribosomal protein S18 acetylase RimI-like enzyme
MKRIRPVQPSDSPELAEILRRTWGSTEMDTRGRLVDILALPGFIAQEDDAWLGYLNYENREGDVEIIALEALVEGQGVASALLARAVEAATEEAARRLWLLTSNDNTPALRFYQRRGFVLVAVHRDAITHARATIKPELPLVGRDDIPLRDEIELELPQGMWRDFVTRYGWERK